MLPECATISFGAALFRVFLTRLRYHLHVRELLTVMSLSSWFIFPRDLSGRWRYWLWVSVRILVFQWVCIISEDRCYRIVFLIFENTWSARLFQPCRRLDGFSSSICVLSTWDLTNPRHEKEQFRGFCGWSIFFSVLLLCVRQDWFGTILPWKIFVCDQYCCEIVSSDCSCLQYLHVPSCKFWNSLFQEWDGLVRIAFVRKNKTLSAAFK